MQLMNRNDFRLVYICGNVTTPALKKYQISIVRLLAKIIIIKNLSKSYCECVIFIFTLKLNLNSCFGINQNQAQAYYFIENTSLSLHWIFDDIQNNNNGKYGTMVVKNT